MMTPSPPKSGKKLTIEKHSIINYFFRLLDGAIPSDLLSTYEDVNRIAFPENIRDDLIRINFMVDIDVLTPPPPELVRRDPQRAERPAEERWIEVREGNEENQQAQGGQDNGKANK